MNLYIAITILICFSAGFSYVNQRLFKLPFAIGLFVSSTILSLFVISSKLRINIPVEKIRTYIELASIDKIVIHVLLGFLLFAGALHTNWANLKKQIKPIATFAVGGILLSTIIIAALFYGLNQLFNLQIDFIYF